MPRFRLERLAAFVPARVAWRGIALCSLIAVGLSAAPDDTPAGRSLATMAAPPPVPASAPRPRPPPGDKAAPEKPTPTRSLRPKLISIHAWRLLTDRPEAPWTGRRTALYTYVLVGDLAGSDAPQANAAAHEAREALARVLVEVRAGQNADSLDDDDELLMRANQFCVPARTGGGQPLIDTYDFDLAARYLDRFKLAAEGMRDIPAHLGNLGPFLLATRKPLFELFVARAGARTLVDHQSPLLLVDLSGKHPQSMASYVLAFKTAVRDRMPKVDDVVEPLGPAFASAVLRLNEALPFVTEAYAGTRKMFTTAGVAP